MQTNRMASLWHVCNLNKSFIFIHKYRAHWNGRDEKRNEFVQYFLYGYWSYAPDLSFGARTWRSPSRLEPGLLRSPESALAGGRCSTLEVDTEGGQHGTDGWVREELLGWRSARAPSRSQELLPSPKAAPTWSFILAKANIYLLQTISSMQSLLTMCLSMSMSSIKCLMSACRYSNREADSWLFFRRSTILAVRILKDGYPKCLGPTFSFREKP